MQHFKTNLQITSTYVYQNGKDPITSYYLQLIFLVLCFNASVV